MPSDDASLADAVVQGCVFIEEHISTPRWKTDGWIDERIPHTDLRSYSSLGSIPRSYLPPPLFVLVLIILPVFVSSLTFFPPRLYLHTHVCKMYCCGRQLSRFTRRGHSHMRPGFFRSPIVTVLKMRSAISTLSSPTGPILPVNACGLLFSPGHSTRSGGFAHRCVRR